MLLQVRLMETVTEGDQEFDDNEVEQIRVLELTGEEGSLQYRPRLFRKNDKGEWFEPEDETVPVMTNKPLTYIPFIFLNHRYTQPTVANTPLVDHDPIHTSHSLQKNLKGPVTQT